MSQTTSIYQNDDWRIVKCLNCWKQMRMKVAEEGSSTRGNQKPLNCNKFQYFDENVSNVNKHVNKQQQQPLHESFDKFSITFTIVSLHSDVWLKLFNLPDQTGNLIHSLLSSYIFSFWFSHLKYAPGKGGKVFIQTRKHLNLINLSIYPEDSREFSYLKLNNSDKKLQVAVSTWDLFYKKSRVELK